MLPVEIYCRNENVILRARNSEILILPTYARVLRTLTEPKAFSEYFLQEALINRPARKLFEAWLRKDNTLWPRLFQNIQTHITLPDASTPQVVAEGLPAVAEASIETESISSEAKKASVKKAAATGGVKKASVAKKSGIPVSKIASKTTTNSSTKKTGRKKV